MTGVNRRLMLAGVGASMLGGCADPFGVADGAARSGAGATGIVGTLTDFGSLIVNGLKLETGEGTEVTDAFGAGTLDALLIGNSLTVEAEASETGLSARRVHVTHPVIGIVEEVLLGGIEARVAGVRVLREPGAVGGFEKGQTVAISGIWQGPAVVASRVDPIEPRAQTVIAGQVGRDGKTGKLSVAGHVLGLGNISFPRFGTFATVLGTPGPDRFEVEALHPGRFTGAAGPITSLSVEGFLETVETAPFLAVSGLGHSFDESAKPDEFREGRGLFQGRYTGTFAVERGISLPEQLEERRALMQRILGGEADDLAANTR